MEILAIHKLVAERNQLAYMIGGLCGLLGCLLFLEQVAVLFKDTARHPNASDASAICKHSMDTPSTRM